MERILLTLTLSFLFIFQPALAQEEDEKCISDYFVKVPLSEAHKTLGNGIDHDFSSDSIKVLVWNIKKTQEKNWKKEFTAFSKDRDLLMIQEAFMNDLYISTLDGFRNFRWDLGISFLYKLYNYEATGTMIGSYVAPTEFEVKQTVDYEPVIDTPKAMTIAKYEVEGRSEELLVINVHGINMADEAAFVRHMEQVRQEVLKHKGPILLAGDFNTRTDFRIDYLLGLAKQLGLEEIKFKNGDQRMRFKFTDNYLDWGFVRGLSVKSAEVYGFATGSDHKPLLIEVSVK